MTMLSVYQRNHLLPTYHHHGPRLYPPMVEASRAHVVMLSECGVLPAERAASLLAALDRLRSRPVELPEYDGTFEDVYFALERNLAAEAGISQSDLDVQLARSRNDLDAGVFRMILRDEIAAILGELLAAADSVLDAAERGSATTVLAYTHRRPAQPTTIGHVLAGYADALRGQAAAYLAVLDELNSSPLGAAVIAGTDLPISSARVADLLGFADVVPNAYSAVAGADHFTGVVSANARTLATGARVARVLQEWMAFGWIAVPDEFCQGSSAMPQKRNPVVLEHMASMAIAAVADQTAVVGGIAAAWWEDSNNATTDIQTRLWESNDRALRFLRMMDRLFQVVEPASPPDDVTMVAAGATSTAAADALSMGGVPFRAAHGLLAALLAKQPPATWDAELVTATAAERDLTIAPELVDAMLHASLSPRAVLDRPQPEGPGTAAVAGQIAGLRESFAGHRARLDAFLDGQRAAASRLDAAVRERIEEADA
ncbi:lyase family protein [Stackebrandtia soli]|uniref:lyase family protein n=1 Tax=Stackebrandtia soli TaxID=1892856 RepID=UPI0039E832DE